jgi:hypothetical protein
LNGSNGSKTGTDDHICVLINVVDGDCVPVHVYDPYSMGEPTIIYNLGGLYIFYFLEVPPHFASHYPLPFLHGTPSTLKHYFGTISIMTQLNGDYGMWVNPSIDDGYNHVVSSTINGSHGEATNEDDLADRIRARKEAKNHLHGGQGGKVTAKVEPSEISLMDFLIECRVIFETPNINSTNDVYKLVATDCGFPPLTAPLKNADFMSIMKPHFAQANNRNELIKALHIEYDEPPVVVQTPAKIEEYFDTPIFTAKSYTTLTSVLIGSWFDEIIIKLFPPIGAQKDIIVSTWGYTGSDLGTYYSIFAFVLGLVLFYLFVFYKVYFFFIVYSIISNIILLVVTYIKSVFGYYGWQYFVLSVIIYSFYVYSSYCMIRPMPLGKPSITYVTRKVSKSLVREMEKKLPYSSVFNATLTTRLHNICAVYIDVNESNIPYSIVCDSVAYHIEKLMVTYQEHCLLNGPGVDPIFKSY